MLWESVILSLAGGCIGALLSVGGRVLAVARGPVSTAVYVAGINRIKPMDLLRGL